MSDKLVAPIVEMMRAEGLTPDDLVAAFEAGGARPRNVKRHIKLVRKTLSEGTLRGYDTHFRRFAKGVARQCSCECSSCLGDWEKHGRCTCRCKTCKKALRWKPANKKAVRRFENERNKLAVFVEIAQRMSRKKALVENRRRAARGLSAKPDHGQGGREMAVTALRCLFGRAVDDGIMATNPAEKLDKGSRSEPRRHALSADELDEVLSVVVSGGDDPELDLLLTWAELELGARRGGIVSLKMGALLPTRQTVRLHEKRRKQREQPASEQLLAALTAHAVSRGGTRCSPGHTDFDPESPVLYYRDSTPEDPHPLTSRRFDTLHARVQRSLPWANEMIYSGHALRHTTGTIADRIAGSQVAQAMLGHGPRKPTDAYLKARQTEVANAFSKMTGSRHPLAGPDPAEGC